MFTRSLGLGSVVISQDYLRLGVLERCSKWYGGGVGQCWSVLVA